MALAFHAATLDFHVIEGFRPSDFLQQAIEIYLAL